MASSFEQQAQIFHTECDPWDRMTPAAMLRRAQEIATAHCESLGIDDAFYSDIGVVFLLARVSLRIHSVPVVRQALRIATHAYGMERARFHRLTQIVGSDGDVLCEADMRWALVDVASRRILRHPPEALMQHFDGTPPASDHDFAIPKARQAQALGLGNASYSLCDRNGHINNANYADLICDSLPLEKLKEALPRQMVLAYRNEIPLGSDFQLEVAEMEGGYFVAARQQDTLNFESFVTF